MAEFRWIQMLSFLILMLQFNTAATEQTYTLLVRFGDEVTLPCGQSDCGRTEWLFKDLTSTETVQLIHRGTIVKKDKSKSDRLTVTADCSLLIKTITVGDAGSYTGTNCSSQHNQQQYADFHVHLSVINMTEHENNGEVTLFCSVLDVDKCAHTVQWIYEGEDKPSDMKISARSCTATVTFTISDLNQRSKFYELLKCNVMNQITKTVQLFPFSRQSSGGTTAAATQQIYTLLVRFGDEVTLPCGQSDCGRTEWLFRGVTSADKVQLNNRGTIVEKDKSKSDRLTVTADCSLLIKTITVGDAGCYTATNCSSQHNQQQQYADFHVHLSVISMTEHENNGEVTLFCSVLGFRKCAYTVQWIYEGEDKPSDMKISARYCTASVTFTISDLNQKSKFYELLKCNVMNKDTKTVQLFPFSRQCSDGTTGETAPTNEDFPYLLRCIIASVGSAALLISAVTVNMWAKSKVNKTQMEKRSVHKDEDEGTVTYENSADPSASVRLH
ncbi:uncharacterized protein LOC115774791 [Archocentrus centrarchus]|uniref:uncharacterized protein LOC115774791 n=1 Tax=Archocentrus centrarchus TaxID=63155 RepID=UPI0011E9DD03|nr:uncharacterized protein LOC115774791 [Archocentrus centrarchus]